MKRFPIGLTAAAAVGLAVLLGLGVWQLKRLAWKQAMLAKIAALRTAAPRPMRGVLTLAVTGRDVAFVRVAARCAPSSAPAPAIYRYALRDGQVGWRLMGFCRTEGGPWAGIVVDRGLVTHFTGKMSPLAETFPPPAEVTGVLRTAGVHTALDVAPRRTGDGALVLQSVDPAALQLIAGPGVRPAPYYLAVETESPAPAGVIPAALPQDIPNNHFVYALTWFGLAGVLVWTWIAYVWRGMRAP